MTESEVGSENLGSSEIPKIYKGNLYYYNEPGVMRSGFTLDTGVPNEPALFENLHYLKNGDRLKIISRDNPNKSAWEGIVFFVPVNLSFEQQPGISRNLTQDGLDTDKWNGFFREGLSAILIPAPEVKAEITS